MIIQSKPISGEKKKSSCLFSPSPFSLTYILELWAIKIIKKEKQIYLSIKEQIF